MKSLILILILATAHCINSLHATEYNLQELADNESLTLFNRECRTNPDKQPEAVLLNAQPEDGVAWIKRARFSEGTIELEIQGANRPGRSFVGLAFHGENNQTYQAVYLRPFNFKNPERAQHSLQYISSPNYHWRTLRTQSPGKYESAIKPAPQPESWVKLKLLIENGILRVHVNDTTTPQLVVELIDSQMAGQVDLWVGNNSDGAFRNLKIEEKPIH